MLSSILDLPLLMTIGSGIVNFLLFLVELGFYGITLLFTFFIIKGFVNFKIKKFRVSMFLLGVVLCFVIAIGSLSLGYYIGSINI